jgi:hypothetical protein
MSHLEGELAFSCPLVFAGFFLHSSFYVLRFISFPFRAPIKFLLDIIIGAIIPKFLEKQAHWQLLSIPS